MFTEQYIKMCREAKEIQEKSPVKVIQNYPGRIADCDGKYYGSFFCLKNGDIEILHYDNDECRDMVGGYTDDLEGIIWLPRQDQLQEMVWGWTTWEPSRPLEILYDHIVLMHNGVLYDYFDNFRSAEELWLTFVMKVKFSKRWSGTEWVKEEEHER